MIYPYLEINKKIHHFTNLKKNYTNLKNLSEINDNYVKLNYLGNKNVRIAYVNIPRTSKPSSFDLEVTNISDIICQQHV